MRRVLIVGATSTIAEATARRFAAEGDALFLAARNAERLQAIADDLRVRGAAQTEMAVIEATDYAAHAGLIAQAQTALGGLDTLLIAHGTLPDQKSCEASFETTHREIEVNALSVISILTHAANLFEQQRQGTIAVISSVAGDRGRQSNYVYGSAKAAVTSFLQGLRNRLHPAGVQVLTVKPGFVDTPMTSAFPKGPLWASPEQIARGIHRAIQNRKDLVYLPGFWRLIMRIIREIPEAIFKRLSL
jgi:decaprenylphospho-beta-D-erythro-pentofuranosid-2-ulose 2-reductase